MPTVRFSITRFSLATLLLIREVLVRRFSTKASPEPRTTGSFLGSEMLLISNFLVEISKAKSIVSTKSTQLPETTLSEILSNELTFSTSFWGRRQSMI